MKIRRMGANCQSHTHCQHVRKDGQPSIESLGSGKCINVQHDYVLI